MLYAIIGTFDGNITTLIATSEEMAYKAACKMLLDHSIPMNDLKTDETNQIRDLISKEEYNEAFKMWDLVISNEEDEVITIDATAEMFDDNSGPLDIS